MLYKGLPILVLGLTLLLTAAAIEFLPETLYFPVVEYSTPENIRIALLKNGELDQSSCEQGARQVANAAAPVPTINRSSGNPPAMASIAAMRWATESDVASPVVPSRFTQSAPSASRRSQWRTSAA